MVSFTKMLMGFVINFGGGSDKSFVGCGNLLDILVLNPVDFVCSSFIKTWLSGFFRVLSP